MRYTTVIFDLDGTLLNTLDDLTASVNHAMDMMGMPRHTLDEVRRFVGNGVRVLIRRSVPAGTSDEDYESAYNYFEEHYAVHCKDKTGPYEGVPKMLSELCKMGYKTAIVSNKIDFAVKELRDDFFADTVPVAVGDDLKMKNKPAPDMVFKALRELGSDKSECVYVGDTDVDLETAKNAGMDCVSVSWGFRSRAELEGYGARMIADVPADILKFI
ncbi:MAG TPA: HAD-IIIA family hydrolase [Candidatus Ornithomonoglobus merdipullorum]|uniref:HAD-IIIA family hydrolase n=1 Tax=Candidatus Ornithomonoglobus merdipullorum TaxID=2840895 RepID=A0A9D1SFK5_9FIRM|nr:HAD-IIIA family hydrolase [Candidatus Ornithomonoglobus merdipullorum]